MLLSCGQVLRLVAWTRMAGPSIHRVTADMSIAKVTRNSITVVYRFATTAMESGPTDVQIGSPSGEHPLSCRRSLTDLHPGHCNLGACVAFRSLLTGTCMSGSSPSYCPALRLLTRICVPGRAGRGQALTSRRLAMPCSASSVRTASGGLPLRTGSPDGCTAVSLTLSWNPITCAGTAVA